LLVVPFARGLGGALNYFEQDATLVERKQEMVIESGSPTKDENHFAGFFIHATIERCRKPDLVDNWVGACLSVFV
jgi:hypothetical protein